MDTFQKEKILSFGNITMFNCFACLLGSSCSLHHEPLPLLALGLPGGTTSFGTRQKVLIRVHTSHSSGFSASAPPAKPPSWEFIPAKTHSWQYRVEEKEGLKEMLHPFLLVNFYMNFVHEKMKMKSKCINLMFCSSTKSMQVFSLVSPPFYLSCMGSSQAQGRCPSPSAP